jgi:hypothetical protein
MPESNVHERNRPKDGVREHERDDDDQRDCRGAAQHEVGRAIPCKPDGLSLEHDQRREQAPSSGHDHAGDDEQDQADDHAEAVQDRGADERPEPSAGFANERRDPLRRPALVDVANDVNQRALHDDRARERERERQEPRTVRAAVDSARRVSSAMASTTAKTRNAVRIERRMRRR